MLEVRWFREILQVVPRLVEEAPTGLVEEKFEFVGSGMVVYHVEHLHCQFVGCINNVAPAGEQDVVLLQPIIEDQSDICRGMQYPLEGPQSQALLVIAPTDIVVVPKEPGL